MERDISHDGMEMVCVCVCVCVCVMEREISDDGDGDGGRQGARLEVWSYPCGDVCERVMSERAHAARTNESDNVYP